MTNNYARDLNRLYETIGKNVKHYREKGNLTQEALANKLGYKSVSTISGAEVFYQKRVKFNIAQLHQISLILDVPITNFFINRDRQHYS